MNGRGLLLHATSGLYVAFMAMQNESGHQPKCSQLLADVHSEQLRLGRFGCLEVLSLPPGWVAVSVAGKQCAALQSQNFMSICVAFHVSIQVSRRNSCHAKHMMFSLFMLII